MYAKCQHFCLGLSNCLTMQNGISICAYCLLTMVVYVVAVNSMCPVREIPSLRCRVLETMLQGGRDGQSWWSKLARDLGQ